MLIICTGTGTSLSVQVSVLGQSYSANVFSYYAPFIVSVPQVPTVGGPVNLTAYNFGPVTSGIALSLASNTLTVISIPRFDISGPPMADN